MYIRLSAFAKLVLSDGSRTFAPWTITLDNSRWAIAHWTIPPPPPPKKNNYPLVQLPTFFIQKLKSFDFIDMKQQVICLVPIRRVVLFPRQVSYFFHDRCRTFSTTGVVLFPRQVSYFFHDRVFGCCAQSPLNGDPMAAELIELMFQG